MPSRRSFLAAASAACTALAGCSALPRLRSPPGTDWSAAAPRPDPFSTPVVTDGVVTVPGASDGGSDDGRAVAFDVETGEPRWDRSLGRITGLTAADGRVYVSEKTASREARVHALAAADGTGRWSQPVDNLATAMTVAGGHLLVAGGTLAALDTRDGTVRWERHAAGEFDFTVVLAPEDQLGADDGLVYVGDDVGVVALRIPDGETVWTWEPERWSWTDVGPMAVDDTVFVGGDGAVAALSRRDGSLRWRTDFGTDARTSGFHRRDSSLLVASGTDEAPSDTFGTVYELSVAEGRERYEMRFDAPVDRTASTEQTLVVGTRDGTIAWVPGASFFERPETTVPGRHLALGAAGQRAFVGTDAGKLWALSPPER